MMCFEVRFMDPKLIEKLWLHTDKTDKDNARRFASLISDHPHLIWKSDSTALMPSMLFLKENSQDLFMSFHHESSNRLRHYHDFFEMIYVCKGTPVGVINDKELQLQEGSLCIMNPNAVHYFRDYTEKNDLVLNIVLAKDVFQRSLFRLLFNDPVLNAFFIRYQLENENQPSFLFLPRLDPDIDHLIELLLREYLEQNQYSQVIIDSLLTLIFSFILRIDKESARVNNPDLAEILGEIYRNYQSVQLGSLAGRFNYHPKYLSTMLHRQTGQTFRSLVTSIRLQNAVNYLLYTDWTIEMIAGMVGYKERSSFYGAFSKLYGISPGEYRKNRTSSFN